MDYAFVPGRTDGEKEARQFFNVRVPKTSLVGDAVKTVHDFTTFLATPGKVPPPIGDLLIGTHAADEGGYIGVPLFKNQKKLTNQALTNYETLDKTTTDSSLSINIPTSVTQGFVHIRGCNIGKARPFLTRLRQVMGGNVSITAPLFFDEFQHSSRYGSWEYMAYEFVVRNPKDFDKRDDLVDAFKNGGFKLVDNITPVPSAQWEDPKWIPANIKKQNKVPSQTTFGDPIGDRSTIKTFTEFRIDRAPFTWNIQYTSGALPPASEYEQRIRASIESTPLFNKTPPLHPFPGWVRLGYEDLSTFYGQHTWTYWVKGRTLFARGARTRYTVVQPIIVNGKVVINFFPLAGKSFTPVVKLNTTDTLYFAQVP
jgi:hypothetical protein